MAYDFQPQRIFPTVLDVNAEHILQKHSRAVFGKLSSGIWNPGFAGKMTLLAD
jgi:hypothetical protein